MALHRNCVRSLGLRCPRSQLVTDVSALRRAVKSGEISIPFVAKPLDFDGSQGVLSILRTVDLCKLDSIQYTPVIVQEFVAGIDVAASVYCNHGSVNAFVAHRLKRGTYFTFESDEIRAGVEKIVLATKAHGVMNFDMRIAHDGVVYWLECNPRLFLLGPYVDASRHFFRGVWTPKLARLRLKQFTYRHERTFHQGIGARTRPSVAID